MLKKLNLDSSEVSPIILNGSAGSGIERVGNVKMALMNSINDDRIIKEHEESKSGSSSYSPGTTIQELHGNTPNFNQYSVIIPSNQP